MVVAACAPCAPGRAAPARVPASNTMPLGLRRRSSPLSEACTNAPALQQKDRPVRGPSPKAHMSRSSSSIAGVGSENVAPNSARERRPAITTTLGSENVAPNTSRLQLDGIKTFSGKDRRSGGNSFAPPVATASVLGDVTSTFANVKPEDTIKEKAPAKTGRATLEAVIKVPRPAAKSARDRRSRGATPNKETSPNHDAERPPEYAADVSSLLESTQAVHLPDANYMDGQPHVNLEMRAILIDWLVDVCRKYKCGSQTLFLTVALLDRHLACRTTERRCLQLVGVAALLCAGKFEEQFPPTVRDLVHVTDKTYTPDEVRDMEVDMLTTLEFRLVQPVTLDFLPALAEGHGLTTKEQHLAQYVLELALLRPVQLQHTPRALAAAAAVLAARLGRRAGAGAAVEAVELERGVRELRGLLLLAESNTGKLKAVQKKFADAKLSAVSKVHWVSSSPRAEEPQTS